MAVEPGYITEKQAILAWLRRIEDEKAMAAPAMSGLSRPQPADLTSVLVVSNSLRLRRFQAVSTTSAAAPHPTDGPARTNLLRAEARVR
jgi:hypothetical protein